MNDKMIKFSILIERIWFAFIFIFLGLSFWKLYTIGWPNAGIFFAFPIIALFMFLMRRRQRIKMQNERTKDDNASE